MQPVVDAAAIRDRLLELLAGSHFFSIEAAAGRLRVDPAALRACLSSDSPVPCVEVLCAMVEFAGVDPTWLVTGHYDIHTHRDALNQDSSFIRLTLSRLLSGRITPPGIPAINDSRIEGV